MRWLVVFVVSACGDNLIPAAPPDAPQPDAMVIPDALTCTADLTTDESNCGACNHLCHGGEVCKSSACGCPVGIIPPIVLPIGDQFFGAGGFTIALAPTLSVGGVNGLVFGYDASVPIDTDIDLSMVALGATPFVGSAVGLDVQTFMIDASYIATAGTLRYSKHCDTEIQGTLANATFNGISGGLLGGGVPMVDPDGCVVHVSSLTFHVMTAACP